MRGSLLLALLVAACATAPRSAFPPLVNLHSPTLCYVERVGTLAEKSAAAAELARRGFACTPADVQEGRGYWEAMAEQQRALDRQARQSRALSPDAAFGLGLLLLTAPGPQPRGPIVCHTTPNGQTTVCN